MPSFHDRLAKASEAKRTEEDAARQATREREEKARAEAEEFRRAVVTERRRAEPLVVELSEAVAALRGADRRAKVELPGKFGWEGGRWSGAWSGRLYHGDRVEIATNGRVSFTISDRKLSVAEVVAEGLFVDWIWPNSKSLGYERTKTASGLLEETIELIAEYLT